MVMTKIKICGLKRLQDIEYVNEFLPDFIGFVFAGTKRKITDEKAKEFKTVLNPRIKAVGVFVNDTLEHISFLANNNIIDIIQLHGDEDKEYIENLRKITNKQIIKAVRVKNSQSVIETKKIKADYLLPGYFLSDSGEYGGTGKTFNKFFFFFFILFFFFFFFSCQYLLHKYLEIHFLAVRFNIFKLFLPNYSGLNLLQENNFQYFLEYILY